MIYTMTILDNVLDIANNFNISSNDRYIAYKLFEYCDEIEKTASLRKRFFCFFVPLIDDLFYGDRAY